MTMQTLKSITDMKPAQVPALTLDSYQSEILSQLHLEFFLERCRILVSPNGELMPTGPVDCAELEEFRQVIEERAEAIQDLKRYLIFQLALYSALLETNSLYISLNNHLIIARFVPVPRHPDDFEVKIYTASADDLPDHYKDKIYVGRDFISITRIHRDHFGLKHIVNSLSEQITKLQNRFKEHVPEQMLGELGSEYLQEIEELIADFREASRDILERAPVEINTRTLSGEELTRINRKFRELKHILIEMEDSTHELESVMFDLNLSRAVRYVTKFNKDLANYINYILLKINGRITDAVNHIRL